MEKFLSRSKYFPTTHRYNYLKIGNSRKIKVKEIKRDGVGFPIFSNIKSAGLMIKSSSVLSEW